MSQISRRNFLKVAGIAGAGVMTAGLAGCNNNSNSNSSSDSSGETDKVILGYWGGTCELPIYVGYEKGFFTEAGLEPEIVKITEDVAPLMANGTLDCFELTPDKFKPMEQGLQCVIIDSLHYGCQQGVASAASGISTASDLEGKKVAAEVGSIAQIMLSGLMVDAGKDPNKVEWVSYKNAQMDGALASGEIDAFAAYDPWPDISLDKDSTRKRFWSWTFDDEIKDILCCFVGLSTRKMEDSPNVAKKLCDGFKKSADWIRSNVSDACTLAIEGGYVPVNTDAGFTREMMEKEVEAYRFISGDKNEVDKSFKYIWESIHKAGAMDSSPVDLDGYITGELYEKMVKFQGN